MNQQNGGWTPPQTGQPWGQPAASPAQPQQPQQGIPQAPQGLANGAGFQQTQMPPPQQFAPPAQRFGDDPFAGLTSGSQENRFTFLNAGHHRLRIDKAFVKNTRKGKTFFALELTVNATNNLRHPPTSQATVFIDLGNEDMRGRHLSRLVCAVHGFDPNGMPKDTPVAPWQDPQTGQQMPWSHYLSQAVSEQNPWCGVEIGSYSKNILTERGTPFSVHHWRPAAMTEIPSVPADETPEVRDPQPGAPSPGTEGYTGPQPQYGGASPQPQYPAAAPGYPPQQYPASGHSPQQGGYPPQGQQWHQGGHPGAPQPAQVPSPTQAPQQPQQPQGSPQWNQGGHQGVPQVPQNPPGVAPQGAPPPQHGAAPPPWGGPPQGGAPPGRGQQ